MTCTSIRSQAPGKLGGSGLRFSCPANLLKSGDLFERCFALPSTSWLFGWARASARDRCGTLKTRIDPSSSASFRLFTSTPQLIPSRNRRATTVVHIVSQWRILRKVLVFRETSLFTRQIVQKFTDSEYRELQAALILRPELAISSRTQVGFERCVGVSRDAARESAAEYASSTIGMHQHHSSTCCFCIPKPIETTCRRKRRRRYAT